MLNNIKQSTGVDGCVLTAENLLYFTDAMKSDEMRQAAFVEQFGCNDELVFHTHNIAAMEGFTLIEGDLI